MSTFKFFAGNEGIANVIIDNSAFSGIGSSLCRSIPLPVVGSSIASQSCQRGLQ